MILQTMKTEVSISLTLRQVLYMVKQLPKEQKIRLAKELEKEAVASKLSDLLQAFHTNELSQDIIDQEVEATRQEMYEQAKKY